MWTDPKSALVQIETAMRLNPKGGYLYQGLYAQCLARTGRIEEALNAMRAAVKSDPTDYSLLELYNILRNGNRIPEAVEAIKKSHKERKVAGLYIAALQFLRQEDRLKEGMPLAEMAITAVEKNVNAFPFDVTAAYTLKGDILMLLERPKEARALWQKVIDLPLQADNWTKLAQAHLAGSQTNNDAGAVAALLQDAPSAARRHWLKTREYVRVKNVPAQIFEMKEAIRLNPQNAIYHYEFSMFLGQLNLKVEQMAELLAAARVGKEDMYAFYAYQALKAADRPDEAIQAAIQGALKSEHRSAPLYILLGNYYLEKGDYVEALRMTDIGFDVEKFLGQPDFQEPALYLMKGDILHKQNKIQEARAAWQKAANFPTKTFSSVQEAQNRLAANP